MRTSAGRPLMHWGWLAPACTLALAPLAILLVAITPAEAQITAPPAPTVPAEVPVNLNPQSTAILVLDLTQATCGSNPTCTATVPSVVQLLATARAAGVPVIYSSTPTADGGVNPILADVAPLPGDPVVVAHADKFIGTDLANIIAGTGASTVVIVGTAANGAVLYTAFGANERGLTAVVLTDGISSTQPFATFLTEYQLLNEPGYGNGNNTPLMPNATTLSRSDLLSFGPAM